MAGADRRYVIIHGHFYQPPRESPWTGLIAQESGAAPFPNWNERILSECYAANGRAHTMEGKIARIQNNYEALSFDFGPTLLAWMERHGRAAYRNLLRADALSSAAPEGCGNAIAQSYNHSILPLLSDAEKAIQIAWGIEDFRFRFGRVPQGIWLPECAVDAATLGAVAQAGLKFVILAPSQGRFTVDRGNPDDAGAGPFTWQQDGLSLAVLRFDSDLTAAIAFGDLLEDGAILGDRLAERAAALRPCAALLVATDGETFGHHRRAGAAELARCIARLRETSTIELVNCTQYLAAAEPVGRFDIDEPSSWSCAHGIERWRSDCGCRLSDGTVQTWRSPLREAMDFVRSNADAVYEREAGRLTSDPRAALEQSIRLALDPDPAAAETFFSRFGVTDGEARGRLLTLFEMERAAHAALTSCAWFFDDFGGPEGRVVLRWAARALELAGSFVSGAEAELIDRLRQIRSNRREIGDAATLYLSLKTREARGRG